MSNQTATAPRMSLSDIDGFLQMFHTGKLTEYETGLLKAILRKLGRTDLLIRETYEAKCGRVSDGNGRWLTMYNLNTGETA